MSPRPCSSQAAPLSSYPAKTSAVILLDERVVTVRDSGDIKTNHRLAIKILRPEGQKYAVFPVGFDRDTRITFFRGWSFPQGQPEYEVKEKDAIETGYSGDSLYSDVRRKILSVPASGPGTVVAFEYEQKNRPFLLQDVWEFQRTIPVRKARFVLQLPPGWEFKQVWRNFALKQPAVAGNQWTWYLEDLPAIEYENYMPSWSAIAGQMALTYLARGADAEKSHSSWSDVGAWYISLAAPRLASTAEIARQARAIAGSAATPAEQIDALAAFVQRQIRYVAIPIGIGSHQPHAAAEVLGNRYGDCKDKATLLKALLKEIGIDSFYLLVHSERGSVNPEFASVLNFNHVILAIQWPGGGARVFATVDHPVMGKLALFDPTDALTPFGMLPDPEQSAYGLLVRDGGGEMLKLPVHGPGASRLIRIGKWKLLGDGSLEGSVTETRSGKYAVDARMAYRSAQGENQTKVLENFLGESLGHFVLTKGALQDLDGPDTLKIMYSFTARNYGKSTGPMLLLRPRVLGQKALLLGEKKDRKYSVNLSSPSVQSDVFEIELPPGYEVDELPRPVTADYPFAQYTSKIEMQGRVLRYERHDITKQVEIPKENFGDLRSLQRLISADERGYAVLKKVAN